MATSERKQEAQAEALNLWDVCRVGGNLGSQSSITFLKMFLEVMSFMDQLSWITSDESDLTLACNLGPTGSVIAHAVLPS